MLIQITKNLLIEEEEIRRVERLKDGSIEVELYPDDVGSPGRIITISDDPAGGWWGHLVGQLTTVYVTRADDDEAEGFRFVPRGIVAN